MFRKILVGTIILAGLVTGLSQAQDSIQPAPRSDVMRLGVTASTDFASKYVWRGLLLTDGAVLQPSLELSLHEIGSGTLAVGWWGNMEVDDIQGNENRFTEYDWTLYYRNEKLVAVGGMPAEIEVGVISYYALRDGLDDSDGLDLYGLLTVPLKDPAEVALKGFFGAYYEADDVNGWYLTGGAVLGLPITDKWTVEFNSSLGWGSKTYNQAFYGTKSAAYAKANAATQAQVSDRKNNALNDLQLGVRLNGQVDEHVTVSFALNFSEIMSSKNEENADLLYGDSDNIWFVWGVSASF